MGRCPDYLNVDDFDRLAASMGLALTDHGVSALGEIAEYIAKHLLERAREIELGEAIDFKAMISAAEQLGVHLQVDWDNVKVKSATL